MTTENTTLEPTTTAQNDLFGDLIPTQVHQKRQARIAPIQGRPRPDWMADDAREALANQFGELSTQQEHDIKRLCLMYLRRASYAVTHLARQFDWPQKVMQSYDLDKKWDVDQAFSFLVYLHGQTSFKPVEAFLFGMPRADWFAGAARTRIAKLYEGGHLPGKVNEEIRLLGDLYRERRQMTVEQIFRKLGWADNTGHSSVSDGSLSRSSGRGTLMDVKDAFEWFCSRYEQADILQWNRRGQTVRRQRKDEFRGPRGSEKIDPESTSIIPMGTRCGPRMSELMDADERFFFERSGNPWVCPMSDEARAEFLRLCNLPAQTAHQGRDVVQVEALTSDESQCWYAIDWYPHECVISLYVKANDAPGPKLVDFWVRGIGSKTREYLPASLRTRLWSFLYEDGPYEP